MGARRLSESATARAPNEEARPLVATAPPPPSPSSLERAWGRTAQTVGSWNRPSLSHPAPGGALAEGDRARLLERAGPTGRCRPGPTTQAAGWRVLECLDQR